MKKHWKIGLIVLFLISIIAVFSITKANKDENSVSSTSPAIAQRTPRRIPPLFREVMEREGINPAELRDNPELQQKIREEVRKLRKQKMQEAGFPRLSGEKTPEIAKPVPDEIKERLTEDKPDIPSKNETDYYGIIVQKNLFLPLGSGAEEKRPDFKLLGTVIAKNKGDVDRALIMDYRRNQSVYVAEGDKIGDANVEKVEPGHVVLFHEGEEKEFRLEETPFLGGQGGGGRRPRGGGPPEMRGGQGRPGQEQMERRRKEEMERQFKQRAEKMKERFQEEMKRRMMKERNVRPGGVRRVLSR